MSAHSERRSTATATGKNRRRKRPSDGKVVGLEVRNPCSVHVFDCICRVYAVATPMLTERSENRDQRRRRRAERMNEREVRFVIEDEFATMMPRNYS